MVRQEHWLHAWTLYNANCKTDDWHTPPDTNPTLHIPIRVFSRKPSGWYFTVPQELREKGWLPERGGVVICECSETEMNFWTQDAYNLESLLESESQ